MSTPTYMGVGDPARGGTDYSDYYPAWLDNLADDVTIEGSLLDGAAHGPDGLRALVTRSAAGQTQHIAANYRPRSSLLLLSRLQGEKFAGTQYADYFLASES
jgi:hypothetical protein